MMMKASWSVALIGAFIALAPASASAQDPVRSKPSAEEARLLAEAKDRLAEMKVELAKAQEELKKLGGAPSTRPEALRSAAEARLRASELAKVHGDYAKAAAIQAERARLLELLAGEDASAARQAVRADQRAERDKRAAEMARASELSKDRAEYARASREYKEALEGVTRDSAARRLAEHARRDAARFMQRASTADEATADASPDTAEIDRLRKENAELKAKLRQMQNPAPQPPAAGLPGPTPPVRLRADRAAPKLDVHPAPPSRVRALVDQTPPAPPAPPESAGPRGPRRVAAVAGPRGPRPTARTPSAATAPAAGPAPAGVPAPAPAPALTPLTAPSGLGAAPPSEHRHVHEHIHRTANSDDVGEALAEMRAELRELRQLVRELAERAAARRKAQTH